jgi:hypothetical protein
MVTVDTVFNLCWYCALAPGTVVYDTVREYVAVNAEMVPAHLTSISSTLADTFVLFLSCSLTVLFWFDFRKGAHARKASG